MSGGAGDTTLNLLWRVQNGEGPAFSPKVVVLLIGTNDLTNPVYALVSIPFQEESHSKSVQRDLSQMFLLMYQEGEQRCMRGSGPACKA